MALLIRREMRLLLTAPSSWVVMAAFLLLAGLFFVLRLASGQGGDQGGFLREMAAVLIPAAALYGAGALSPSPRLASELLMPISTPALVLARVLPPSLLAAIAAAIVSAFPLLLWWSAPIDPGRLFAGTLALTPVALVPVWLSAAAGAWLGHRGAAGLTGFVLGMVCFGAEGVARATGFGFLHRLDLAQPLLLGGIGWLAPAGLAPHLTLGLAALGLAWWGMEVRRA